MPLLNISVTHGQTLEKARENFEFAIGRASERFGTWIKRVDWAPDRTSATLTGTGFEVKLWYDAEAVHATGDVPWIASLIEAPLKRFLQETFRAGLPRS